VVEQSFSVNSWVARHRSRLPQVNRLRQV
jgi:hypothetical protein